MRPTGDNAVAVFAEYHDLCSWYCHACSDQCHNSNRRNDDND